MHTAYALRTHRTYIAHALHVRCMRLEQVEQQAALLQGSAAMARVQPLVLHEVVLVGTQALHAPYHARAQPSMLPTMLPKRAAQPDGGPCT